MVVYVAQYCWPADYCIGKFHHTWQITGPTEVDCTLFLSLSLTFQTGVDCYRYSIDTNATLLSDDSSDRSRLFSLLFLSPLSVTVQTDVACSLSLPLINILFLT